MVMPWMNHGNVKDAIANIKNKFSIDDILARIHGWVRIALLCPSFRCLLVRYQIKEIASGLAYLHSEEIAHGDLRGVCS